VNDGSCEVPAGGIAEVVGVRQSSSSVKPIRATSFGEDFHLKNYDGLVELMNGKYADKF